jgi:hypothetical protein
MSENEYADRAALRDHVSAREAARLEKLNRHYPR